MSDDGVKTTYKGRLGSIGSCKSAGSIDDHSRSARSEADIDRVRSHDRSLSPGKKIKRVSFSSEGGYAKSVGGGSESEYEDDEETPSPESQHLGQLVAARRPLLSRTQTVSMLNQIAVGEYCIWEARVTPPTPEEFGEEDSTAIMLGG